ncbi:MAG: hypothetical protein QOE56_1118 [Solirubrobacterales bacterium]|nr:hypothetical protein [Solirubrobacterales bacterium]
MATYVDEGGLVSALGATDNGIVSGRRGTGKTHALLYLAESKRSEGHFCVYLDVEQDLGSTEGLYADSNLPLAERATRLLVDVLGRIHEELLEEALQGRGDVDALEGVLDHFGEVLVEQEVELTETKASASEESSGANVGVNLSLTGPGASASLNAGSGEHFSDSTQQITKGTPRFRVHFGQTSSFFRKALEAHPAPRVWLLIDEWSGLPLDLQPYLAEMLRRLFFGSTKVTVRLGSIPHRSEWRVMREDGSYVGIETGSEIFPLLDLDEFVVFPARNKAEQTERSTNFFKTLLFRHLNSALIAKDKEQLESPDQLVSLLFTQVTALQELVRAAEGVPRDALQIVSRAGLRAGQAKISTEHVRAAAAQVFQTTKSALLNAVPEAQKLLQIITDEVISKKARAFLLRQEHTRHPLIQRLIDDRILHVIKRGYSSKDDPGERFDVLQIDFGCYVSFLQTGSAPETLLGGVADDTALDALFGAAPAVPEDDYRAIRSSVLDLPGVLQTVEGSKVAPSEEQLF